MQPIPTPIPLTTPVPVSGSDFLGIPAFLWILLVGVIIVQSIALIRRRR